ncbi:MAG: pitrilysin family protein [Calditrichia bacterium]
MKNVKVFHIFLSLIFFSSLLFSQKETPPEGSQPKNFVLPAQKTFTLNNGLQVTMVPYGTLPMVTVRCILRAGNLNEPADEVWVADLTDDLLKEGTTSRSAEDIAREAANMGGAVDVSTGSDQSWVGGEVLNEFGPKYIALLADVIQNPSFPETAFERLRKDFLRNLSIAKTRPQSLAMEKFNQVLYGNHPYGHVFPTAEMLQGYTIEQVKSFYDQNIGAQRTHIYVVGKFDEEAMGNAIHDNFDNWKKGPEPLIDIPKPQSKRAVYIIDRPDAPQSTIYMGVPVVDPSSPDYIPLQVTNTLLGGAFSSRITANIREEKGYTYSPRSSISTHYRNAYWAEVADVGTDVTGASLKEIFKEIHGLQNEAPSQKELTGIQNYMAGTFVLRNSAPTGIIGQLSFIDLHGLDTNYLNDYVNNLYQVKPEDVQRIAQTYFVDNEMTIVIVGDRKKITKQVKPFGKIIM